MKWRIYAERELPKVLRELRLPCFHPVAVTGMTYCPRHDVELKRVSRVCSDCQLEAWSEVQRRYASAEQGRPVLREPTDPKEVSMTTDEVVEGELLPDVYEAPRPPSTLFGTSDPEQALERMAQMARLLVDVVRERKLVKKISGNDYLLAPGWAVLAGMTGLAPYTAWTRPLEDGTGWMARVEVRRISDGAIISAAEQVCSRSESKWSKAEEHALLGMAQTRASSRALRGPLAQVVELAGYKGTPAEEMVDEPKPESSSGPIPDAVKPTEEQLAEIRRLISELTELESGDWKQYAREIAGVPGDMLTRTIAGHVIHKLSEQVAGIRGEPEVAA